MTLEQAQEVFRLSYAEEVNKYSEDTPNFRYWFRSGPHDGEADIERRYNLGLAQVRRFVEYYTEIAPDEETWVTHNGDLAVEFPFEIELGTVPVRGYIDDVIDLPKSLRVRDNKTGKDPGDVMQLKLYGIAIEHEFDVKVTSGDYWMGRTGTPTVPYNLTQWSEEWVTDEFGKLDTAIRNGEFDPDPEPNKCTMCSVSVHCDAAIFS
jgi:putative RecB family exonuclease